MQLVLVPRGDGTFIEFDRPDVRLEGPEATEAYLLNGEAYRLYRLAVDGHDPAVLAWPFMERTPANDVCQATADAAFGSREGQRVHCSPISKSRTR